jgi:flagellar basal body P-ring protein FlgI
MRSQSPEEDSSAAKKVRLIGDLASTFGTHSARVHGVGLVTGLRGTGSDPVPSPQRSVLLAEMQRRGVEHPGRVLRSRDTSLVVLRGTLPPGVQEGDRFDIEVWTLPRSQTTSLRSGQVLSSRLKEMAVLADHRVHEGHVWAVCQGPVMVDPAASGDQDRPLLTRGRILGGGVALKSRPLALVLKPDHQNVLNSARVEKAVNRRFHRFDKGLQAGMATAKTDELVELRVHPRYQNNIDRYLQVVRAIPLRERPAEQQQRLAELRGRLLSPPTAAVAAVELEAVGNEAVDILLEGIRSADPEVRFYSAESLAYLDRHEAAAPLGQAALTQPAFRVFALTALSVLDDYAARDQLQQLLSAASAETRYGAFRALWAMRANDPIVMGEELDGQFSYHVLNTSGPPMIHVTRSRRPEIVLFGKDQQLLAPLMVKAGNEVLVKSTPNGEIAVSRYAVDQPDQRRVVSRDVDDVIRAIVEVGGTYPDVVQALQEAKAAMALSSRFVVDALPRAGRLYTREGTNGPLASERRPPQSGSPLPNLFSWWGGNKPSERAKKETPSEETAVAPADSDQAPRPIQTFFARIAGRDSS